MSAPTPGPYRHFKGNRYELLAVARHSETEEELCVYRPEGSAQWWVRPLAMWSEVVEGPDGPVARFTPLG